ncbi:hypothetical protein FHX81_4163 [Saccharothrix saharensis]|uniref:Uncharacterized protein n=1 Tax=Saccharothrix saharensis TaxID=571190 RepID=A0A543JG74_9PSEU|nr:hypothetical protein [Saccharothrix saharensis]TQM81781.1 hypothetical protein FHX81_4163 [Saccharothrix saharensis]
MRRLIALVLVVLTATPAAVPRSSDDRGTARTTHGTAPWGDDEPTTIVRSPRGGYVVDGELGALVGGTGTSDAYSSRRFRETAVR